MRMEYCAYSFLSEDGSLCDYEIATDELASMTAVCAHHVKHIKRKDIQELVTLIYHANGSIRGKCAIQKQEVMRLHAMYEFYFVRIEHFVLPVGSLGTTYLHVFRAKTKAIIRILTKLQKEGHTINHHLLDFMNLLANTFFMMCLYENKAEGISEQVFISKSYES